MKLLKALLMILYSDDTKLKSKNESTYVFKKDRSRINE